MYANPVFMQIKYIILFVFLLFLPTILCSQWIPQKLLPSTQIAGNDSNKLSFSFEMIGFFKNNEYFGPLEKGRTLPGTKVLPKLVYQVNNNFRAELGAYSIYYSGEQEKGKAYVDGVFARMQYSPKPELNLVLGNIYGGVNHRLIEPLYQWERQFVERPESGLQVIFQNERYFADTWINWKRYIERGDSVPEVLTFGFSLDAKLTKPKNYFQVSIPVQLLINHSGGQIDTSDEPMVVKGNLATGICVERFLKHRFFESIALKTYLTGYYDKFSNKKIRPYNKGWGAYPVVQVNTPLFSLMTGYWYAERFYSLEGEQLFGSFNPNYPSEKIPVRKLITCKLIYSQQLLKNLTIGAQVETYSDLKLGPTDYSFGLFLRFDQDFILKK